MFETMIVASMEAFIVALESSSAVLMQMKKVLQGGRGIQPEADLTPAKFAALQKAFATVYRPPLRPTWGTTCPPSFARTMNGFWSSKLAVAISVDRRDSNTILPPANLLASLGGIDRPASVYARGGSAERNGNRSFNSQPILGP
jgi:hypothetical protein